MQRNVMMALAVSMLVAPLAKGADSLSNLVAVATVAERDTLARVDGLSVLVQATGNIHRYYADGWHVLNESGLVNVKDYGAVGDGAADDSGAISNALYKAWHDGLPVVVFPSGTYRVTQSMTGTYGLHNLQGLGRAIIDGPGPDKPLFQFGANNPPSFGDTPVTVIGLTFQNFRNVIRAWSTINNSGWAGTLIFENCAFRNGDYVMANNMTQDLEPIFNNVTLENCNLFKGGADGMAINNLTGTTKTNAWTGGWCESGGMEDGISNMLPLCVHANHIIVKPGGVNTSATADQSWFKLGQGEYAGASLKLSDSRFGGDGGGIPLVKNMRAGNGLTISGVDHVSSWRPRYILDAPLGGFLESGVSGAVTGTMLRASSDVMKVGFQQNIMLGGNGVNGDSRFLVMDDMSRSKAVNTVGTVNYNTNTTPDAVFDKVKVGAGLKACGKVDAGFEGLKGQRYEVTATSDQFANRYYAIGPRLTANLNFQALTNRFYNLTFFYRSRSLKELRFVCTNAVEKSQAACLADTGGRLAQGTTSIYVGLPGLHAVGCQAEFCGADGFLEIYPIAITEGPFGSAYLSGPAWAGAAQDANPAPGAQSYYSQHQSTLQFMGATAPTNGTWRKGSFVYNNNPEPGKPFGWVCIAGGTPGDWCPFGQIGN